MHRSPDSDCKVPSSWTFKLQNPLKSTSSSCTALTPEQPTHNVYHLDFEVPSCISLNTPKTKAESLPSPRPVVESENTQRGINPVTIWLLASLPRASLEGYVLRQKAQFWLHQKNTKKPSPEIILLQSASDLDCEHPTSHKLLHVNAT